MPLLQETSFDKERLIISTGLQVGVPAILGVSAALTNRQKWLFFSTNACYWLSAALIFLSPRVVPSPVAPCLLPLCSSSQFHGSIITALAAVSTYWHGAQCQILEWLYCRWHDTALLHSPRWLRRLVWCDILCSSLTVAIGISCFGVWRAFVWLSPACVLFMLSRQAKRRREYCRYAILHGAWHILSAFSIVQIVTPSLYW